MLCQYCGAVLSSPRELKFRTCHDCDDALLEDHDDAEREMRHEDDHDRACDEKWERENFGQD